MSIKRNTIEITGAAFLAVVFGVTVLVWLKKIETQNEIVRVAVAAETIVSPYVLKANDIVVESIPRAVVPLGVVTDIDKLVGQVVTRNVVKGGWFSEYDVVYSRDPDSDGTILPRGTLGLLLPANWFVGALPRVKPHDFVFIYAATPHTQTGQGGVVGLLVSNVPVIRVETEKNQTPNSVLVAVNQEQAKALTQARASQVPLVLTVAAAEGEETVSSSEH